ncbi:MAG: tetratricopeptide repeat protein [Phycisphaerae bacterium]|jgi:hypothetical protein
MSESEKKPFVIFIYSVLILSALLVFWRVRNFNFVTYDDNKYVYGNQYVLNGLTSSGVIWAFTTNVSSHWHPLTWLSLMLDCQLFGTNPGRMHLVNLFLHIVNTLLLFYILKKMTGSLWPSAFVAAAFAIHPMHVESVVWIAERKDILSALFWLLTTAAYLAYVRRPGVFRYTITLTLFALGLMAKPMLVTLPFVLLLLDYWPLGRFAAHRTVKTAGGKSRKPAPACDRRAILYKIIIEKIPFLILVVISSVITFLVMRSNRIIVDMDAFPLNRRIANAVVSYARYMGKVFWPQNLAVFYPLDANSFVFWRVVLCAVLLVGISFLVIRFGRKQKYLPVGWFWFAGTLIPVIGLVQVGGQAYADRYTYISYIGLFIMIAWGLPELFLRWPLRKIVLGLSMVIVLTTLGICASLQVSHWKNSVSLFTHAIKVTKDNYIAYSNLGAAYGKLGRYQDEIESCKQAIRIKPDLAEAYNNVGNACGNLGRWQDAIEAYKQAVRIRPDLAEAHYNLGAAYLTTGSKGLAIEEYKILKTLNAEMANELFNLIDYK